jgi:hypothetical protein
MTTSQATNTAPAAVPAAVLGQDEADPGKPSALDSSGHVPRSAAR